MPKPVMKYCFGCGKDLPQPKYYEGDTETPWCVDCFVTEEQLEKLRETMPCWLEMNSKALPKKQIRLTQKTSSEASGAVAQSTEAVPSPPQKKKSGKKLVSQESAPADASPPPQKKKPVLLMKKPQAQPTEVAAVPSESAEAAVQVKKKPVLLKKKTPAAPEESPQSSA